MSNYELATLPIRMAQQVQDKSLSHRTKKTFQSFRHKVDELRDTAVQDLLIKRIVGHGYAALTLGECGSRIPIKAMVEAIHHLHFDCEKN